MSRRWKTMLLLLPLMILLLASSSFIWLRWDSTPAKPQPIPRGDYTYAKALANHRIEQLMKQLHIPGASVALVADQQIIWTASFGLADIDRQKPITEATIFKMWSLAKPFTALEAMRLVEEGQLSLDEPIDHYAPNFTIRSRFADGEPATIRHILAHRSGLPRNNCVQESEWHMGSDATSRMAKSFENCFLAYPVGTRYKYSNAGFDTLGYIIQEQRGQIFPPYMVEELLVPIGMSNSTFWSSDLADKAQLATGYEYFEGDYFPYEQYDIVQIPSGNLYGTVGDLAEFVRFIFREGEANGEQLISPEMLDMMFEDQFSSPSDPQPMGLGWKITTVLDSIKMVWHDGGPTEGIGSLVALLPEEKLGVVLLANSTGFDGAVSTPLAAELLEVMLETEGGAVDSSQDSREPIPTEMAKLEKYQGAYAAFGQIMEVYVDDDRLKGSISGMSFDLVPVAEDRFVVSHWLLKLGLADLLGLPLDLQELEIEFQVEPGTDQAVMIINLGNFSYEICPRYPALPGGSAAWQALAGKYERYGRQASGEAGQEPIGESEITMVDGRLQMLAPLGPILPLDDNILIILSGAFAGETITRDPVSGMLYHQRHVYKPI